MVRSTQRGELRKVLYVLILAMGILGVVPNLGNAAVIPADETQNAASLRQANLASVRLALEKKEVAAKLADYGLNSKEVSSRLDRLSDQQINELAVQTDKINQGGDGVGLLISLVVLILVILLVLYLLGYNVHLPKGKLKGKGNPKTA
jgi:hypothetical protein